MIYHGTPLTPRAALLSVLAGRGGCISFFRPDDVEAVEAVCPQIMFRQRSLFLLDASAPGWARVGTTAGLGPVLRLAGAKTVRAGALGCNPRLSRRTVPAQRRAFERLALWPLKGRSALAHGWAVRTARTPLRTLRPSGVWLGRRVWEQGRGSSWLQCLPAPDGRGIGFLRKSLAHHPHDARRTGRTAVSLRQRRQHQPCPKWTSL